MNETKHTPLPWRSSSWDEVGGGRDDIRVLGANGHHVCYCDRPVIESRPLNQANADFIVRAVNTIDEVTKQRDALLAACKLGFSNLDADLSTMELNRLGAEERERLCNIHRTMAAAIAACEKGGVKP